MTIFKTYAESHWERGLPVIPLKEKSKRPVVPDWTKWCSRQPGADTKQEWLLKYPNSNVGLPLGPASGLIAIDVDTNNPRLITLLEKLLPYSPWRRVGSKGFVQVYKFGGERTEQVKGEDGAVILELLSDGRQVVLPPSIHPDTGQPYTSDRILVSVLDHVQGLPVNFMELIRQKLMGAGVNIGRKSTRVSDFVPKGARDNALVSHAGILARAVMRGERSLVEALSEMDHWCETFVQKVDGDEVDSEKGKQRIVQFLQRDVMGPRKLHLPIGWDSELDDETKNSMQILFTEDHQEWDFPKIRDYLIEIFKVADVNDEKRMEAVDYALEKIARSNSMNALEKDRILNWIKHASELGDSITSLRRRVTELATGEITGRDHAEIASAVLSDLGDVGEVRYSESGFWQWNGACWQELDELFIKKQVVEDYGDLPLGKRSSDHAGIVTTMRALAANPLRRFEMDGINFANGFLNTDLELLDHQPDFGAKFALPYRYLSENDEKVSKSSEPERFLAFLRSIWGKDADYEQKVQALREAFAATLFGIAPKLSRAICLYGVARSGKTTLLSVLENMLPGYAVTSINPGDWGDAFLPAHMSKSALNICGELSEAKKIDGDLFKRIVEGSTISAQFKHRPVFEFKPRCAQWFASNYLPKSSDTSFGFGRRWLFLSFSRVVPKQELEMDLGQKIAEEEREEIAGWAVQVVPELLKRGDYTGVPSSEELMKTMLSYNCSVRDWFHNSGHIRTDKSSHAYEKEMYEIYRMHMVASVGGRPVNRARFNQKLGMIMTEYGVLRNVLDSKKGLVRYDGVWLEDFHRAEP